MELSRRNFLAGLATAGIGAAGMSLAACSPTKDQNSGDKQPTTSETEEIVSSDWLGKEPDISDADVEAEEECDRQIGLRTADGNLRRGAALEIQRQTFLAGEELDEGQRLLVVLTG